MGTSIVLLATTYPLLGLEPARLAEGGATAVDLLRRFFGQPDMAYLPRLLATLGEMIAVAFVGTVGGLMLAIPASLLAARNTSPHPGVRVVVRSLAALVRAVPDIVWALLLVSAVGLGVLPGILALILAGFGLMTRLFAQALEVVDAGVFEGIRAQGAPEIGVRAYAALPSALPDLIGISLYMLDANVRSAAILGIVGAGGLGFDLNQAARLFQYERLGMALVAVYIVVTVIDRASALIRRRLVE